MTANGWFQIFLFFALVLLVTKPVGIFMTRVFNRERTFMDPALRPIERILYRVTGVDEDHEMRWTEYAISMLLFSLHWRSTPQLPSQPIRTGRTTRARPR
jgi:K+-transporting ATPase ATPase A chain